MKLLTFIVIICLAFASCNNTSRDMAEQHEYTNDLINETSPYLLQHAHNPVDWKAWNDESLKLAKDSEKLMLISIGYAACHWCHVMEKESFEDSTVAAVMNSKFINIKVDREERPDVDQIYIAAVELMTGRAGWPLNVIALPDGRPVWGGTYFPKEDWMQRIERIQELYESEPEKLYDYASKLEEGIKAMDLVTFNDEDLDLAEYDADLLVNKWSSKFDREYGGYQGAPKFMIPNNLDYLLRHSRKEGTEEIVNHVQLSLDKMAYGGLYDHIGGGFARYSTDSRWHVPHFEKMLYDNAQLVTLYSNAYAVTGNDHYKEVVYETIDFVVDELTNEEGAFYSSLDADSETASGELEEGAYYIYTEAELQEQLKDDFPLFKNYYNINDFGKWEKDHYVLIRTKSDQVFAEEHGLNLQQLKDLRDNWRETLLNFRNKRPRPRLDDKTLTSWNGLMLRGLTDAYKVFGEQRFLDMALTNANFLLEKQKQDDNRLFHSYKNGKSTINGYLEDYAAVGDAFISLYEVTLDEKWLDEAKSLCDYAFSKFFDQENSMFFFTSEDDTDLVTRKTEYRDNVIPASNSIMAKNLFRLSHYYELPDYAETAKQMLKNVLPEMEQYPGSFSNWMDLLANYKGDFYEIVVVGPEANARVDVINEKYIPNKVVAGSTNNSDSYLLQGRYVSDATLIYVCVDNTCKLPVRDVNKALELIK